MFRFVVGSIHESTAGLMQAQKKASPKGVVVRDNLPKTVPFRGLMRQNRSVRVSVTERFFLLYHKKSSVLGAIQFCRKEF